MVLTMDFVYGQNLSDQENISDNGGVKRKKTAKVKKPSGAPRPAAVSRRNARERKRVKMVNDGFATLRNHVPSGKKNKKLSKVDTLRSAVEYINQLQSILQQNESADIDLMDMSTIETSSCYSPSHSVTSSPTPSHSSVGADDSGSACSMSTAGSSICHQYYQHPADRYNPSLSPTPSQTSADDAATSSGAYSVPSASHYSQAPSLSRNFGHSDFDVLSDLYQWLV